MFFKKSLPVLISATLISLFFLFLNFYLAERAQSFQENFKKQNFSELSSGDTFALIPRLNALSGSGFSCIVGTKNNQIFFQNTDTIACKASFLSRLVSVPGDHLKNFKIDFVMTVPNTLKGIGLTYVFFQILLLFFLIRSSKRAERAGLEGKIKLVELSSQVAHDIRSPLAALRVCAKESLQLPEEQRLLIRAAVQRIEDIANDLSGKKTEDTSHKMTDSKKSQNLEFHLLSSLIEPLISEKRLQHRDKLGVEIRSELSESSYGLFAKVNVKEFKRVLSNLINNAVEILEKEGLVTISLEPKNDDRIQIQVTDNGKGIPPEILSKLGQRGNTFGKKGGSGLGLFHAKTTVESWGGQFKIESQVGKGTIITFLLQKEEAPSWFVPKIHFEEKMTLVIVDDDQSIHEIWKERLSRYNQEKKIFLTHFSNPEQLRDWHELAGDKGLNILCLCDYEFLGCKENGLDIIEELNISKQSILVTSRYEEKDVRERCARLKIKLLPKPLAGFVPLEGLKKAEKANGEYDCILIDDEDIVHTLWLMSAKGCGKNVKTYTDPDDFLNDVDQYSKEIPIYVDSLLSKNRKGEEVSKEINALGFKNIFLATGKMPEDFKNLPWIKGIVGKDPPWN